MGKRTTSRMKKEVGVVHGKKKDKSTGWVGNGKCESTSPPKKQNSKMSEKKGIGNKPGGKS